MKVSELTGAMLDYWVARAEGIPDEALCFVGGNNPAWWEACSIEGGGMFRPSTKWEQGGQIIERERIDIFFEFDKKMPQLWHAMKHGTPRIAMPNSSGESPLVAAMRSYVASKFGDTVENEPK